MVSRALSPSLSLVHVSLPPILTLFLHSFSTHFLPPPHFRISSRLRFLRLSPPVSLATLSFLILPHLPLTRLQEHTIFWSHVHSVSNADEPVVSLNRLSVGCGTTPRRQSGPFWRLLFVYPRDLYNAATSWTLP